MRAIHRVLAVAAAMFVTAFQTTMAGVVLNGGGLTLLEEGGTFAANNLATRGFAAPIAVDELDYGGWHLTEHLNDGIYGNNHSWISDGEFNSLGVAFAGISFGERLIPGVNSIAFGRDNNGIYGDRASARHALPGEAVYTLQYTQVLNPHANIDLPDDTTVPETTAAAGWVTIGTLDYVSAGGENFSHPAWRHRYSFDAVDATGVRLVMPSPLDTCCTGGGPAGASRPAIDEIELYWGPEFRNLDFEDAVITLEPPDQDPEAGLPLSVLASDAIPHWTTNGLVPLPNTILYNLTCPGAGCTSIHDEDSFFPVPPLEGEYTIHLIGPVLEPPEPGPLYISQVGRVPFNATRLTMLVNSAGNDLLDVSFDDGSGSASLALLTSFPREQTVRLVYDIAAFSGDLGELKISSSADFESFVFIDDIQFVPEPGTLLLGGLAWAGYWLCTGRNGNGLSVLLTGR